MTIMSIYSLYNCIFKFTCIHMSCLMPGLCTQRLWSFEGGKRTRRSFYNIYSLCLCSNRLLLFLSIRLLRNLLLRGVYGLSHRGSSYKSVFVDNCSFGSCCCIVLFCILGLGFPFLSFYEFFNITFEVWRCFIRFWIIFMI